MHTIVSNERISEGIYLMTVEGQFQARMGQFFMLRAWDREPILSRPISIFNVEENAIQFLYKVAGEGTRMFARLRAQDQIQLEGPFGNGFPEVTGKTALVGGGIGVAPLLYTAKQLKDKPDIYLGFRGQSYLTEMYEPYANELNVTVNGNLLEDLDLAKYDQVFVCGPLGMMKAVALKGEGLDTDIYVSFEKRMACGIGACYVCSVMNKEKNKKVCSDGPVFHAQEVEWHAELSL
ncbi:dihydroorotate dehydrogenase electron transfer subunit [Paenibacillus aquistagni]|uniref:Dihydroorotate dehydrogenase electron transfer subunit n=1 Tax=Paenibacillus aquistagni TaxID=1852522 RepID=A0A1X7J984_9BACL|nr:dihydroorotate dehydrogenase electron transfer subunit [Paenibacillus aquistagni]NMM55214.1 dihydroorotate dehydrogenase electron transfer subunit [Paenibacillus aquistagni]SMG24095.1 dihydroorotate dehydrogenase electron transfer subunit [Paenibacillus aquistagni]